MKTTREQRNSDQVLDGTKSDAGPISLKPDRPSGFITPKEAREEIAGWLVRFPECFGRHNWDDFTAGLILSAFPPNPSSGTKRVRLRNHDACNRAAVFLERTARLLRSYASALTKHKPNSKFDSMQIVPIPESLADYFDGQF